MIGILLNDTSYEQDIRELLMAFYPGETFAHEKQEDVTYYIEGNYAADPAAEDGFGTFTLRVIENDEVQAEVTFPLQYKNRLEAKTTIKKELYTLLSERTGIVLPWGTLTGIRPTKIALTRLDEGWEEDKIRDFMRETYLTSEEKIDLSVEIAKREKELLSQIDYENGYSLYVGIPFCPTTCAYCSFTSYPIGLWKGKVHLYLEALFKELDYVAKKMKGRTLDTVYFGGGTPTSLSADELDQLLTKIENTFDLSTVKEYTVEAGRPDTITKEKLLVAKEFGVSRISINPQTMNDAILKNIGRRHTVSDFRKAYKLAREVGIPQINTDLIAGLPGDSFATFSRSLNSILKLAPENITVHTFCVKKSAEILRLDTEIYNRSADETVKSVDYSQVTLKNAGYNPYYIYRQKNTVGNLENVGYSQKGCEGLYNVLMMEELHSVFAVGAGAATKLVRVGDDGKKYIERIFDPKYPYEYLATDAGAAMEEKIRKIEEFFEF